MSVTVKPWSVAGKFHVTVYFRWPSGKKMRDRTVIEAISEKAAEKWGVQRERVLLGKGEGQIEVERQEKIAETGLTCSAWWTAYFIAAASGSVGRKNKGNPQRAIADRRGRFKLWIEPIIGGKAMAAVTSADCRQIVAVLDQEVRKRIAFYESSDEETEYEERRGTSKPGLAAKTAQHIWSEVTSGFREALSSKIESLRTINADPTVGVQPPIQMDEREQEALYPSEIIKLLECEDIPVERRRSYAGAIYTGARRSELERIEAAHVDFDHDVISIVGSKTRAATRQVPIEPSLKPLLKLLVKERPTGPLFDVLPHQGTNGASAVLRTDMTERAKLTRAALYMDSATRAPYTFHAHRHTAITHWACAGRPQIWLLMVAGHLSSDMTRRYMGVAAALSSKFGQPHPPLPASLLGKPKVVSIHTARTA